MVDLGVDRGVERGSVPQHLSNLGQRAARPQHRRGCAVPQLVSVDVAQPSSLSGSVDDVSDTTGGQPAMRCADADEDAAALGRSGASTTQVCRDRRADVRGQRQTLSPVSLPDHVEFAGAPVDVVQAKVGDLTGAEPQPDEQQHDGVVTSPCPRASITGSQQCADLGRRQRLRYSPERPPSHRRHSARERHLDQPGEVEPGENRSCGRDVSFAEPVARPRHEASTNA